MYNLLYRLYFINLKNKQLDILFTRIVIRLTNILLPVYFNFTPFFTSNRLKSNKEFKKDTERYIVSLTTFPRRIDKVWLTIETIFRQKVKPDEIILCLYEGEFNGMNSLPKKLLAQVKRGLQIKFCKENLMPHNKYFYTMIENPESIIIIIDDDFLYPSNFILKLKKYNAQFPNDILCPITRKIKINHNEIKPYVEWDYLKVNTTASNLNLIMGCGGTLFPSNSLHKDLFDIENLKGLCLKTDDLWLKIMSLRNNTKVVSLAGEYSRFFIPLINKNNTSLMSINVEGGQNDNVFRSLIEYYNIELSIFQD